jgi:hypothetical protein
VKHDPARLLAPLLRAVQGDKPIPEAWRVPLVELVTLLMASPDAMTSARAVRVLIEMEGANMRQERREHRSTSEAVGLAADTAQTVVIEDPNFYCNEDHLDYLRQRTLKDDECTTYVLPCPESGR